jgi:hypothetical protein
MLPKWPPSILCDAPPITQGLLYAIWDGCIQGGGGCNHGPPNGLALGSGSATAAHPIVVCAIILGRFCAKPEDPSSAMKLISSDSMFRPLSTRRIKSDIAEKLHTNIQECSQMWPSNCGVNDIGVMPMGSLAVTASELGFPDTDNCTAFQRTLTTRAPILELISVST